MVSYVSDYSIHEFASERVDTFDNFYNSQQVKKTTFVKHFFSIINA
jgi:hypothetical protein